MVNQSPVPFWVSGHARVRHAGRRSHTRRRPPRIRRGQLRRPDPQGIDLFFAGIHTQGGPAPVRRFLPDSSTSSGRARSIQARSSTSPSRSTRPPTATKPWTSATYVDLEGDSPAPLRALLPLGADRRARFRFRRGAAVSPKSAGVAKIQPRLMRRSLCSIWGPQRDPLEVKLTPRIDHPSRVRRKRLKDGHHTPRQRPQPILKRANPARAGDAKPEVSHRVR